MSSNKGNNDKLEKKRKRKLTREDLFNPRYGPKTGKLDIFDGKEINDSDDVFSDDDENERDVRTAIAKLKAKRASEKRSTNRNRHRDGIRNRLPLLDANRIPDSPQIDVDEDADGMDKEAAPTASKRRAKRKTLYELVLDGDADDEAVDRPSPSKKKPHSEFPASESSFPPPPPPNDGEVETCRKTLEFDDDDDGDDEEEGDVEGDQMPSLRNLQSGARNELCTVASSSREVAEETGGETRGDVEDEVPEGSRREGSAEVDEGEGVDREEGMKRGACVDGQVGARRDIVDEVTSQDEEGEREEEERGEEERGEEERGEEGEEEERGEEEREEEERGEEGEEEVRVEEEREEEEQEQEERVEEELVEKEREEEEREEEDREEEDREEEEREEEEREEEEREDEEREDEEREEEEPSMEVRGKKRKDIDDDEMRNAAELQISRECDDAAVVGGSTSGAETGGAAAPGVPPMDHRIERAERQRSDDPLQPRGPSGVTASHDDRERPELEQRGQSQMERQQQQQQQRRRRVSSTDEHPEEEESSVRRSRRSISSTKKVFDARSMRLVDEETLRTTQSSNSVDTSRKAVGSRIPMPIGRNTSKTRSSPREIRSAEKQGQRKKRPILQLQQHSHQQQDAYDNLDGAEREAEEAQEFARNKSKSIRNKSQFLPSNLLRPLPTIGPDGVGVPLIASTPMRPEVPPRQLQPRVGGGGIKGTRLTQASGKAVAPPTLAEAPLPSPREDDEGDDAALTADDDDVGGATGHNDTLASEMSVGEDAMSFARKRLERATRDGKKSEKKSKNATPNLSKSDRSGKKKPTSATKNSGKETSGGEGRNRRSSSSRPADRSGKGREKSGAGTTENDGGAVEDLDARSVAPTDSGVDGLASRVAATVGPSKRAPSASFAVPDPIPSPSPPSSKSKKNNKKKKTTTTTTTTIKTTKTKKKIITTQVVSSSHDPGEDGPRRSGRNRTEINNHCSAVYKWENGYKVKVGEVDMAEDPKYAHLFVKGALTKKKGGKRGRKASSEDEDNGRKSKKRGGKAKIVESYDDEEEEEDAVDPANEWIDVLADDQSEELASKRIFRPTSSHVYMSVNRGAVNTSFMKTFDQENYSSGALILGPSGVKESQLVKNADMIFFCQKGEARVTLHETEILVKRGDTFCAPRFNKYSITNVSGSEEAKLVFFQAKF